MRRLIDDGKDDWTLYFQNRFLLTMHNGERGGVAHKYRKRFLKKWKVNFVASIREDRWVSSLFIIWNVYSQKYIYHTQQ